MGDNKSERLVRLIDKNGEEIFYCDDLFLTVADIIEHIKDEEDIVSERQTRASAAATEGQCCLPNNYLLKESLETALTICHKEFKAILTRLQQLMEDSVNNNFNHREVKNEFEMIYEHKRRFRSNTKPANCWPAIFNLRLELGVKGAFIIAKICLVTLSNA